MQPLTCPIPSNINPLQSNGFLFGVNKLPEISFFCQEATLPELTLPSADMESPLTMMSLAGDKLTFGELSVTFLIDEEMINYVAIHNWLVGLGFPESHEQYQNFISNRTDQLNISPLVSGYSDGTLQILGSSNKAVRTIQFVDLVPTSLSSIQLQSTTSETTYLAGSASFRYTLYKFIN